MQENLDAKFWQDRWENGQTQWDIGYPSTPLKTYIDGLTDKSIRILIPGCGNAYEGIYLYELGFSNVQLIDLAQGALDKIKLACPSFPAENLIHGDFFDHKGQYDLILEQTFFCALNPSLREDYVKQMHSLLKKNGILTGVLFNIPCYDDRPPFGGNEQEYREHFKNHFEFLHFEKAFNSIPPRAGSELFIELRKI